MLFFRLENKDSLSCLVSSSGKGSWDPTEMKSESKIWGVNFSQIFLFFTFDKKLQKKKGPNDDGKNTNHNDIEVLLLLKFMLNDNKNTKFKRC